MSVEIYKIKTFNGSSGEGKGNKARTIYVTEIPKSQKYHDKTSSEKKKLEREYKGDYIGLYTFKDNGDIKVIEFDCETFKKHHNAGAVASKRVIEVAKKAGCI